MTDITAASRLRGLCNAAGLWRADICAFIASRTRAIARLIALGSLAVLSTLDGEDGKEPVGGDADELICRDGDDPMDADR